MDEISEFINRIICEDCIEATKRIPDAVVDFVITDPPFNVGLDYKSIDDDIPNEDYSIWCSKWIKELYRVLKPNHYCIVFSGDKKLYWLQKAVMESGFIFHHYLKWHKPTCQRALAGTVFFGRTELALVLSKEKPSLELINRKELYQDTITCDNTTPNQNDSVDHPARRPIKLYLKIIKGFTKENDLVLDCFLGSGTTAIACKTLNRNFIGIEIDPEYCKIAEDRLKNVPERLERWV